MDQDKLEPSSSAASAQEYESGSTDDAEVKDLNQKENMVTDEVSLAEKVTVKWYPSKHERDSSSEDSDSE